MTDDRRARAPRDVAGRIWAFAAWAAGMLILFYPTLSSRLARVQSEWNDTRLNNYFLEHGWRWLTRAPTDLELWRVPAFFPAPNTAAYSELLVSAAPPYWLLRAAGAAPDTAFQLWLLAMASLDYGACYLLLRRTVRVDRAAASLGAFVFAFGAPRGAQVMHAQLMPQFFTVCALYALWRLLESAASRDGGDGGATRGRWRWVALFFASVVAQFYGGFYLAWFFCLSLLVAAIAALAMRDGRRALGEVARRDWRAIVVAALASAAALWPLASHYLRAAHEVGLRELSTVAPMLPRPASWLYLGPDSWIYGGVMRRPPFDAIPAGHEQRLGLGVVTTLLCVAGLWRGRREPFARVLLACAAALVAVSTLWIPDGGTGWTLVYHAVPGAAALRAVSRIGLMLLVPAAFGMALAVQRLATGTLSRRGPPLAPIVPALAIVVAVEQGQTMASYDRSEARARSALVARAVPPGCRAFLYTPVVAAGGDPWWYHVDAMWAAFERDVPTVNGYSGNLPLGWHFFAVIARTPREDSLLGARLSAWERRTGLDSAAVCRVRLVEPESTLRAARTVP